MNNNKQLITTIRQFNRFYANILGLLDQHVLNTGYSLTEARIILEIGFIQPCIANQLVDKLTIDRSYMSRIITKLSNDGILSKETSTTDNRISLIHLTSKGMTLFNQLNERSDEQIMKLLHDLSQEEIAEIHNAMLLIQRKLGGDLHDTI
ncbi:MarR family winged helix-turn-helix transcriptional regulator [Lysinibacillus piscis]|uniref:HTH marR-type domain-containing protein n=1 Tax=Lysinibacillus piscis TaxID=2518931 RepID=A0ABQ5NN95_9BACI|nr:MarR family transcriptional regulator [Lysinibacillus sp. KH24]GLC89464.1 hypothetical protein LYSBPC_25910 [Lysinibacillus sp. KH24]